MARLHAGSVLSMSDTSSRWMKRAPSDPEQARALAYLSRNHREADAALDFFTVTTITSSLAYCLRISHDRRRILHSISPRSDQLIDRTQQCEKAFPLLVAPGFVILMLMASLEGRSPQRCVPEGESSPHLVRGPWQRKSQALVGRLTA